MTLETGTRLGPYEIVAPIGAGGMGEVYRARDTRLGRSVAIKILGPGLSHDARLRLRLDREAKVISALNHPHICTLHDVGLENGVDYLVMEHCEGKTLARRLADGPLPMDQLLDYAMQIADALDKAHRQGIIHRDLKPSNLMITKSGVKVLDFGLAKERSNVPPDGSTVQQVSEEGALLGTVQYMAPEVLHGKEADARSDIFALGLVMYEMVTGQPAYSGSSKASLIAVILEREPKPIAEIRPDASPALVRIINAYLTKDPDERLQSAHDVMLGLQWSAERGMERPQPRRPGLWIGATAALVALTAVVVIAVLMRRPAPEPARIRHLAITLPVDAPVVTEGDVGNLFAISPDGSRLVYVGPGGLHVRILDRLTGERLPGTEDARAPFFSPDGNWVGFATGRALKKVSLAGGNPVTICEGIQPRGAFWGADDKIVFAQLHSPLMRIAAAGGTPEPISALGKELRWPSPLPGGRDVLVTISDKGGEPSKYEVALVALADGKVRTILAGAIHAQYVTTGHLLYWRSGTVYRVPFDIGTRKITGQPQPILDDVAFYPAAGLAHIAVSGKTIYYVPLDRAAAQDELVWVDRRGGVTPAAAERQEYRTENLAPRLSPDGRQVLTQVCKGPRCDVWRYEIERGTWNRVTSDGRGYAPLWSSDGRSIVYVSNRTGPYNLFSMPADGSSESRQLTNREGWPFAYSWSRDGTLIAVGEYSAATGFDIWFIPADGKSPAIPYLTTSANETAPAFSPDGRWVAYQSTQSGEVQVYVKAANGKGSTWRVSVSGGSFPRWRDDGKELFYRQGKAMMAVDIGTTSTGVSLGKPRTLFEDGPGKSFDVTSDGRRFLMVRAPQLAPHRQINVAEGLLQ